MPLISGPRPALGSAASCAPTEAVCVHAPPESDAATAQRVQDEAIATMAALPALGLPRPPMDGGMGGDPSLDLYLRPGQRGAAAYADPRQTDGPVDRATAYALIGTAPSGPPCTVSSDVVRAVVQAALLGFDPAMNDGTLAMYSSYLASLLAPCPTLEAAAIDRFQRSPERALISAPRELSAGSLLLASFFDERYGTARPGEVLGGIIAASAQGSPPALLGWLNEPDIFDTLRKILPPRGLQLGDLLGDFAVARAFVGSRADGNHLRDVERFGDLGRVRFEWSVELGALPKRLAPLRPVQSTGSSYLWLKLDGARLTDRLVLVADWEQSFVFQWLAVRVDSAGRELGRLGAGGLYGTDHAELTVTDLSGAAGLLIVGTNLGHDDRSHPYDPDDTPPREASYEIAIYRR